MGVPSARFFIRNISKPLHMANQLLHMAAEIDRTLFIFSWLSTVVKATFGCFPHFCAQFPFKRGCGADPNYLEKQRSIATYKSVELFNRQNMKMALIEGFSSGLAGGMPSMEIQTIFLVAVPKISTVPELSANTFLTADGIGILLCCSVWLSRFLRAAV